MGNPSSPHYHENRLPGPFRAASNLPLRLHPFHVSVFTEHLLCARHLEVGASRKITLFASGKKKKKKSHISLSIYETKREHGFSQALGRDMGFRSPRLEPEPPRAGSASAAFGVNVLLSGWSQGQLQAAMCIFCHSHHPLWTAIGPFWNSASPLDVPVCQTIRLPSMKAHDQRGPLRLPPFLSPPFSALQ